MIKGTEWAKVNIGETYHVIPVLDLKDHEDGWECWCKPSVEHFDNGNVLVSHHAADGREFFEQPEGH